MVYGVKIKNNKEILYFESIDKKYSINTYVIVEYLKNLEYGKIVNEKQKEDLDGKIIRKTTKDDYNNYLKNLKEADKAKNKAQEIANDLKLEMKFLEGYFSFDKKQLLLTFTALERVDFRELTKRLASIYKTRIELRQIGARDKASNIGGIGPCGRELCCSSFLNNLGSVSMNMAKNQSLALNPSKINGSCGRLLCCLAYEDEQYKENKKNVDKDLSFNYESIK